MLYGYRNESKIKAASKSFLQKLTLRQTNGEDIVRLKKSFTIKQIESQGGLNFLQLHTYSWVSPDTGELIPADGKGFNPFDSNIYARPADWAIDNQGFYYVGASQLGQMKMVRPTSPTSASVTNIAAPINNKRRFFYPPQLPNENKRFVSYPKNKLTYRKTRSL